ncbi:MAG: ABC transporter ATP-binding protein [Lachnospiraceae bacterium]|nr:ABC transporter ATP-binding protein [Lachnospiraceae bacterium]
MLELKNVSKSYRGFKAVDNVSFAIDGGQTLGVVGANGAGKTTLTSMIATLTKPDSGEILLEGVDLVHDPGSVRPLIGYVPQDIALYETLSGLDNLKFWGRINGVPKALLKERIEQVCRIIRFDDGLLKKRVSEYSGGMKRRLNIGVALLHSPRLVIMDEPTTGIDMQSADQILEAIEELRRSGIAVIYIGHYMEEIERIATHLCVMNAGKVAYFGEKDRILNGKTLAGLLGGTATVQEEL